MSKTGDEEPSGGHAVLAHVTKVEKVRTELLVSLRNLVCCRARLRPTPSLCTTQGVSYARLRGSNLTAHYSMWTSLLWLVLALYVSDAR